MTSEKNKDGGGEADIYHFKSRKDIIFFTLLILALLLLSLYLFATYGRTA